MAILKGILGLLGLLIILGIIGWLGLRVKARAFSKYPAESGTIEYTSLPEGLPAPLERYARLIYGEQIPIIHSAVIIGRMDMNRNGMDFQTRFKIYHQSGENYYHLLQMTWFGFPIASIHERFQDGHIMMDIPGQHIENEPKVDSAANQGLWSEALFWTPAVVLIDSRIQWESIDENTVKMILPNARDEEMLTIHFDPETGLIQSLETLRYQEATDEHYRHWSGGVVEWGEINGQPIPIVSDLSWDNQKPWAVWHIEQIIYNVDVSRRMEQYGGQFED